VRRSGSSLTLGNPPCSLACTMADHQRLDAFFALLIFAFAGSIILLLTAVWSPAVKRHPAWLSLMFSNTLATASYSLLFFFGYKSVRDPPFELCVIQAALAYAAPVLWVPLLSYPMPIPNLISMNSMAGTSMTLIATVCAVPFSPAAFVYSRNYRLSTTSRLKFPGQQ
jgi:hypothetical protein